MKGVASKRAFTKESKNKNTANPPSPFEVYVHVTAHAFLEVMFNHTNLEMNARVISAKPTH